MKNNNIYILAIETSCDDTGAAVIENGNIISNIISTQDIHKKYGGVVPEFASRSHNTAIVPIVDQALKQASIKMDQLSAIAFTQGPGLLGSLIVGNAFAKALAYALEIPLIAVHHIKAHVLSNFIDLPYPNFPFLCLIVSGGHTQILLVKDYLNMEILGQTADDAVGEAFDKTAKMMGLTYPGGTLIDKYAIKGDPHRFVFPIANMPNFDFSFSGFKTAFMNFLNSNKAKDNEFIEKNLADLCASVQHTLISTLLNKLYKAIELTGIKEVAIAGGVAANSYLRKEVKKLEPQIKIYIPNINYCMDNAAMVAIAAHFYYKKGLFCNLQTAPLPRFPIVK
jgi:N6-L-threonylcarbamoyladenine synthase